MCSPGTGTGEGVMAPSSVKSPRKQQEESESMGNSELLAWHLTWADCWWIPIRIVQRSRSDSIRKKRPTSFHPFTLCAHVAELGNSIWVVLPPNYSIHLVFFHSNACHSRWGPSLFSRTVSLNPPPVELPDGIHVENLTVASIARIEFHLTTTFLCSFFIPYPLPQLEVPKYEMVIETLASASSGSLLESQVRHQSHWTRTCILARFPQFVSTKKNRKRYTEHSGRACSVQDLKLPLSGSYCPWNWGMSLELFFDPGDFAPKIKCCNYSS